MKPTHSDNPIEVIFGTILGFLSQIHHFVMSEFLLNAFIIPILAGFIGGFGGWIFKKIISSKSKKN